MVQARKIYISTPSYWNCSCHILYAIRYYLTNQQVLVKNKDNYQTLNSKSYIYPRHAIDYLLILIYIWYCSRVTLQRIYTYILLNDPFVLLLTNSWADQLQNLRQIIHDHYATSTWLSPRLHNPQIIFIDRWLWIDDVDLQQERQRVDEVEEK